MLRNEEFRSAINQRFLLSRRNTNGNTCKLNSVCSFFPSENRSISIGRNSVSREGKASRRKFPHSGALRRRDKLYRSISRRGGITRGLNSYLQFSSCMRVCVYVRAPTMETDFNVHVGRFPVEIRATAPT